MHQNPDDTFDPETTNEPVIDDPDALADEDWSDFTYGQSDEEGDTPLELP